MDVRLVKGSRRGKILVIDGFRYQRHKSSGALLHWRCWRETCRAKVKTNIFDVDNPHPRIRVVKRNDHNHPDDSAMTEAISFRQQLQEVAAADPTRPPRRIYNTQVAQIHRAQGGGDRPQLPSYLSVRASLQRTRNANIPAIPRNLPLQLLRMNFTQLFNARRTTRLMNRFPALQDFLQYVRNMYVRQGSFFPPAIWNVYQRDMTQRTNNKVEAYHRAFCETVQVRHPSLWTYIWHLKDQQARAEEQMTAAANGEAPLSRRHKWRQLEQRIVRLKNQFINGNRNLEEYWSAVAHCICHFQ
ncbi:hypothetical protein ACOMHN_049397 [Nucella lapillus]